MLAIMYFEAFRDNGFPTYYGESKTPWEADVVISGIILAFVILALSLFTLLPGFRGWEKLFLFTRIVVSLFIGAVIVVSIFSQTWETAETTTRTKYKAGIGQDVNVTVGVNIGLKGVNITLKGAQDQIKGETINYNEHFSWDGPQGRLGFGPHAGRFNQEYRAAQYRGLPLPILWVAEYFTIDGEGIRWGRYYRQAGFYAHVMMWLSFPLWMLSNILFFVLLRYGAYCLMATGCTMLTANIIWRTHRNFIELSIPFTAQNVLNFSFGASFWLVLSTGVGCFALGVVVILLDKRFPKEIATFFGVSVLQDEESVLSEEEHEPDQPTNEDPTQDQESSDDEDDELYGMPEHAVPPANAPTSAGTSSLSPTGEDRPDTCSVKVPNGSNFFETRSFRRSVNRLTARLQRPRRREPPKPPTTSSQTSPANHVHVSPTQKAPVNAHAALPRNWRRRDQANGQNNCNGRNIEMKQL